MSWAWVSYFSDKSFSVFNSTKYVFFSSSEWIMLYSCIFCSRIRLLWAPTGNIKRINFWWVQKKNLSSKYFWISYAFLFHITLLLMIGSPILKMKKIPFIRESNCKQSNPVILIEKNRNKHLKFDVIFLEYFFGVTSAVFISFLS